MTSSEHSKIGLCVCYDTKNFGSQLQVLATIQSVESLGFDYDIIRYKKKMTTRFALQTAGRFFNASFVRGKLKGIRKKRQLQKDPAIWAQVCVRNLRFEEFAREHFSKLSPAFAGYNGLKAGASGYDAFLTGSDQLWLPANLGSHFYTQEFVPDAIPKIAYAPSFGVNAIPWYQRKRTSAYLNRFQHLSIRENAGQKLILELTGKEIPVVADPTMLLDAARWDALIPPAEVIEGKYIFCYFLGGNPEHRAAARQLQEQTGLKIVTIPFLDSFVPEDQAFGEERLFDLDTSDFVNLIRNAEYVLTDSFHGTVFSVLYHKAFLTFNRFSDASTDSRNSRIDSLSAHLGLEDRRYKGDVLKIRETFSFEPVDEKLAEFRAASVSYLSSALQRETV